MIYYVNKLVSNLNKYSITNILRYKHINSCINETYAVYSWTKIIIHVFILFIETSKLLKLFINKIIE